jgi:hypothetical protein
MNQILERIFADELEALVERKVEAKVGEIMVRLGIKAVGKDPNWVGIDGLAKALGKNRSTVWRMDKAGKIPAEFCRKVGGVMEYHLNFVDSLQGKKAS